MSGSEPALLEVRKLRTDYISPRGAVHAVNNISFKVMAGEVLSIVGESGSGKSATALSVMGLMRHSAGKVIGGEVLFNAEDLLLLPEKKLRKVRGNEIAMIFQNPMTTLNPILTVGSQMTEVLQRHMGLNRDDARKRSVELFRMVEIPEAASRLDAYPHQLSGGLRQRVMIALALSCDPKLLIADEATTALDVTTQAQILTLLKRVTAQLGTAMIVITHSMGVVASIADRVAVMYAGRIVEMADVSDIFHRPRHPYAVGLLGSIPRLDRPRSEELIAIEGRPPSLLGESIGCPFSPRCPLAMDICETRHPKLDFVEGSPNHLSACWADREDVEHLAQDTLFHTTKADDKMEHSGA